MDPVAAIDERWPIMMMMMPVCLLPAVGPSCARQQVTCFPTGWQSRDLWPALFLTIRALPGLFRVFQT